MTNYTTIQVLQCEPGRAERVIREYRVLASDLQKAMRSARAVKGTFAYSAVRVLPPFVKGGKK